METRDLTLIPATIGHLEQLIAGTENFHAAYGMRVIDGYLEFPEALDYSLKILQDGSVPAEWASTLIIHTADNALIGFGGYKGQPDDSGTVEIGYGIAPAYRGKGYAAQAADAMVKQAFRDERVTRVIAHTLAEPNASNSVLKKIGMRFAGTVSDPDEGETWRWEIAR